MLSEAELQELRGMAFDRLLLRLWPRGLPQGGHEKNYNDLLLAKRLGVCLKTLRTWRSGRDVPRLSTIRRIVRNLEVEFGVPEDVWMEAVAVSNYARGWVLAKSGLRFVVHHQAPVFPLPHAAVGVQFGYYKVIDPVRRDTGQPLVVTARCLLCGETREMRLHNLRYGSVGSCKPCAVRLVARQRNSRSGFHGVQHYRRSRSQPWVVVKSVTGQSENKYFSIAIDAARYYDSCMYERYGHTLFLNFPDEYDRSNDPVFVPVKRIGDS